MKKFLTDFVVGLAGPEIARIFVLELLRPFNAGDCYKAINDNTDLLAVSPDRLKSRGVKMAARLKGYSHFLTTKNVLEWLGDDRKDLASIIINHPRGYEWLDEQVEKIKAMLFGEQYGSR